MSVFQSISDSSNSYSNYLDKYSTIIIKVGTNSIINENGINKEFISKLVFEASSLSKKKNVVIVTSGAIGLGKRKINFCGEKPFDIMTQQGLAAIGQVALMEEYQKRFDLLGINCAQVLISQQDFQNPCCIKNIQNTFKFLFDNNVIPIVNENDVVATEELRTNGVFSDNDELAAMIAQKIGADLLVMLTLKNGLIGKDGSVLTRLDSKNQLASFSCGTNDGRGGIETKLNAIHLAALSNCDVIVSGPNSFDGFSKGRIKGTFCPRQIP